MDPLELRARVELPPDPTSARAARKLIADLCAAARLGEDECATAALLTSELVTNAIRYGGSSFTLEAAVPAGTLRVAVVDRNPDLPEVGDTPPLTAEGGRGLLLVSTLAARWGIEPSGGGKAVWFELDLPAS